MKRLMYVIPLAAIAVLVFAAIAVAQDVQKGQDGQDVQSGQNGQDGQSQTATDTNSTSVQNSTTLPGKKNPAETTTPAESTAPAPNSTTTVDINDLTFNPSEVNIAPGTTVRFVNNGTAAHTATADNALFDTGELKRGESLPVYFEGSGSVTYHDALHPDMKGSIVVGEGAGGEDTAPQGEAAAPQQRVSKEAPTGNDGNDDSGQSNTATDSSSPIEVNDSEPSSEADQPAPEAAKNLKG